jgi:NAD(P)-dependent dehydrogenase (short-subunit alcohol dehydrogenase family)
MSVPGLVDEFVLWLIPILVGIFVIQYWAFYLVFLWIVFFVTVRLLERINVGSLRDKPVLISGCDSGFGHDLALRCVQEGMPVFAGCFTEQGIKGLEEEASRISAGEKLLRGFLLDIRSDESVQKAREFVDEHIKPYKGLWGIVNNAGIGDNRAWDEWQTPAMYQRFWEINTLGHIRITHAFRDLVKKTKGRIVIVTSIMSKVCMPAQGPYNVSKFAIAAYADTIRVEMEQFGVTVSQLEPGFFKTPQANPAAAEADVEMVWNRQPQHIKDEYGEHYFRFTQKLIAGYLGYKCKPHPEWVVDAYFNALTSVYPRKRYQIGYDSMFQFTPLSYLPTRIQHYVFWYYLKYVEGLPPTAKSVA